MDQPYSTYSANYMAPAQQNPACPYTSGVSGFQSLPQLSGAISQAQIPPTASPSAGQNQINNAPMVVGSGAPGPSSDWRVMPSGSGQQPIMDLTQPMPVTPESLQYLNGFLRTQIGRKVHVEFLVGANTLTDRSGILVAVGANYILLNELETDDLLACDYYNIKFIRFYY